MSRAAEQTVAVAKPPFKSHTPNTPPSAMARAVPCGRCSAPVEPGDAFCASCGAPRHAATPDAKTPGSELLFHCENCGAEVRAEPDTRTTVCPFCATPYVVEGKPDHDKRQDPEFVLGFAVPPEKAEAIYRRWIRSGGWFRPGDLGEAARAEGLRGVYLPFWSFSMRADSQWEAQIGETWMRTETYTTTDDKGNVTTHTRQVPETEWWPLQGGHHAYYSFYLVSGSKGLTQPEAESIQPFELLALKRFQPRYLAGWLTEEYSIEKDEALPRCEEEFRRREQQAISAYLPGDTSSGLKVDTRFSQINSDLILLPIYLRSYRYRDKLHRVLINGQTGKIAGGRPVSGGRVAAFIGMIVALIVVIWLLVVAAGGGR